MEFDKYKACICEGTTEAAIIDALLEDDLLIFQRDDNKYYVFVCK